MQISRIFFVPVTMLMATVVSLTGCSKGSMTVENATVKAPFAERAVSVGYVDITNTTKETRALVSVNAPWAGVIQIHTHDNTDGVMRMRRLENLPVPAGETVSMQPGGLHLMLFELTLPLPASLPMNLCFDDQQCIAVEAQLSAIK
ncbi:MAG: copper chaperone PCu(A)C [Oleibacter sp.]|nr:copper chaperone PCu(A)C [Thalassolituus sp.]